MRNYSTLTKAAAADEQRQFAQRLTSKTGVAGDVLDDTWVTKAKPVMTKMYDNVFDGVEVSPSAVQSSTVREALEARDLPGKFRDYLDRLLYEGRTAQSRPFERTEAIVRQTPISARELNSINRSLLKSMSSQSLEPFEREAISRAQASVQGLLDDALEQAGKGAEFSAVKDAYAHYSVLRDLVRRSGDSGTITPKMLEQTLKTSRYSDRLVEGRAPFQEELRSLQKLDADQTANPSLLGKELSPELIANIGRVTGLPLLSSAGVRLLAPAIQKLIRLETPQARKLFADLNPVEQAKLLEIANRAAVVEPEGVLKKARAATRTTPESDTQPEVPRSATVAPQSSTAEAISPSELSVGLNARLKELISNTDPGVGPAAPGAPRPPSSLKFSGEMTKAEEAAFLARQAESQRLFNEAMAARIAQIAKQKRKRGRKSEDD
jgi:hypothetical protein